MVTGRFGSVLMLLAPRSSWECNTLIKTLTTPIWSRRFCFFSNLSARLFSDCCCSLPTGLQYANRKLANFVFLRKYANQSTKKLNEKILISLNLTFCVVFFLTNYSHQWIFRWPYGYRVELSLRSPSGLQTLQMIYKLRYPNCIIKSEPSFV